MLNLFKKKQDDSSSLIRELLFGDRPISNWLGQPDSINVEPWKQFNNFKVENDKGNKIKAIEILKSIITIQGLETRHYLQAWHFLKELGERPSESISKKVLGVVVEVGLQEGLDILAAYEDHTARYFNFSGAAVIWERPDSSIDENIDQLIKAGQNVTNCIGLWEGERPIPPPKGQVRISFLTPLGLHFGQAPFELLANDKLGGPVIDTATILMQKLIEKAEESKT